MRRFIVTASIAAAALVPSAASAETRSHVACEQKSSTRVGTGQTKAIGAIVDAVGVAIAGNQVTKSARDCDDAFGYYDADNRWHASGIGPAEARGYYDRDGGWVEGVPNGRYGDDNRWIANPVSSQGEGSYNSRSEWIPASANGYYDRNDEWVGGSAFGYHDDRGRWIASVAPVQPDRRADSYGYYDAQGQWHASAVTQGRPSGYYDRTGTWVQGRPNGYYDSAGRWMPMASETVGSPAAYRTGRPELLAQLAGLDQQLTDARGQRTLTNREFLNFKREVSAIRTREDAMAHDRAGNLSPRNETQLQARIDRLDARLRTTLQ